MREINDAQKRYAAKALELCYKTPVCFLLVLHRLVTLANSVFFGFPISISSVLGQAEDNGSVSADFEESNVEESSTKPSALNMIKLYKKVQPAWGMVCRCSAVLQMDCSPTTCSL